MGANFIHIFGLPKIQIEFENKYCRDIFLCKTKHIGIDTRNYIAYNEYYDVYHDISLKTRFLFLQLLTILNLWAVELEALARI